MARLANGSPITYGRHSVPGHRYPLHSHATASCPTLATTNHTLTKDEHACSPPQATWSCPPHQDHPEEACHLHFERNATSPISRAILTSQSAPHTGVHLLQPNSEAYEAEDRCFRVSIARRLMSPHPAASDPSGVVLACTNIGAAGQIFGKSVDVQQHHCYGCRYGRGVDRRRAAVARCLADVIHSHNGTKVYIEQSIPALTRVENGQVELHAWILSLIKTATPRTLLSLLSLSIFQQSSPHCCS